MIGVYNTFLDGANFFWKGVLGMNDVYDNDLLKCSNSFYKLTKNLTNQSITALTRILSTAVLNQNDRLLKV
jgi:hypothetical protein